jgi:ABC-type glycerol-3-phosphate transport system permease component
LLIIVCFLVIVPIYWAVKTSLTGENLFNYPPSLVPKDPHIYFFVDVYYWIPFLRFFMNSVIVSAIVVVSNIIFNAMAGFALGYNFPGKKLIILTYLSCMMVPFQTTIIPAFLLTKYFGLLNTHLGLALPLARPAIATNIILTFVWSWNNFIWPLIITQDTIMRTLPLGLARFLSYFEDTSGQLYAFVIMVIAPIVVVFLMNQKSFISGMMSGAVKG